MKFAITRTTLLASGIATTAFLTTPAIAADGKAVYDKTCTVCHTSGVANAPKFGDKAAWAPRIATGQVALLGSVVKGKGAMPPKAGAADLSEADIKAAVEYMVGAAK